ncbi:efflux RND transporter permease subunit [Thalassotalea psychrophila]|uniref:Efflux RND transporter permease subunit n=1 Tax=Thalassotalea psychrophila TaxID=3065647 RepID=A0ABY9TY66_9GAMM|nr:efflux RND transporter permease subunit [Colwelliaceae bacterium SQ149]
MPSSKMQSNLTASEKKETLGATLATFALKRPVTVIMIFLSLLLTGIISSRLLPLEKFPGIDIPQLWINVPYPDASPAEVERLITRPIEESLATISGIKRMRSTSHEGGADIQLEFEWDDNINAKSIEARENVDAIRHLLPRDVERVLVYQFNTNDFPIFQLRISSEQDLSMAYDLLDRNLKRPLERVQGVSKVELYGVDKRQISIRLDPDKLVALHIDRALLVKNLNENNFSMAAGHFYDNGKKVMVNPVGEYRSIDEIKNLIVQDNILLKDIASVEMTLPIPWEGRHLDQTYAIGMNILKESNANLVDVSKRVLKVIEEVNDNPQFNGINLYVMDDTAKGVTDSLSDLLNAGMLGALLSVGMLYIFLRHFVTTMIVVLSVPISICITLGVMYFAGYSLNILSMMGLLLAVGMLVDNSVVITESIFQEKQKTDDIVEATKKGVNKVSLAVIAGTATTMIVFLPNIVGKKIDITIFLEHVAIAICISLFASLLIAQTLIPLLTSKIKSQIKPSQNQAKANRLENFYLKSLRWTHHHKIATSIIALLILFSIAIPLQFVTGDEEQNFNDNRLFISWEINDQFNFDTSEKIISKMEDYLYSNKEEFLIDSVYSYYAAHSLQTTLILHDGELPISMNELKEKIRENLPKFVRATPRFGFDQGNGGGVQINLTGISTDVLIELKNNLIPLIEHIDGITDVTSDIRGEKKEMQITVDRTAAFRHGLSTQDVSSAIALALRGQPLRTYRHGDSGELDIWLNYDLKVKKSIDELKKLPVIEHDGKIITLDNVATMNIKPRLSEIRRYNRQTAITIQANLDDMTLDDAKEKLEAMLSTIALPSGYNYNLDGSFVRQDETEDVMGLNMLLAVCMIYIVMAALFESLLLPTAVITSLLFSFVGVFWAFLITGSTMSVMGMIGMLILMGIVVNNGIVLVDRINQLIENGQEIEAAVMQGCKDRLRPILMTVSTTILGLIPLALGNTQVGGDGPTYAPMAIAIIGGLTFSTVTSLYLVPLAYVLLLRLKAYTSKLIGNSKNIISKVIKA